MNRMKPETRRWIILGLIFMAMVLNYVDRQIVSVLKPTIKATFAIDDRGYAMLLNVFMVCYASSYIAAGWLVDKFGAGRVMLGGIIAWSCACIGGGFTKTLGQLTVMRGALGIAEPMGFPAQLRTVTIWFPPAMRATANSICAAGSTIGAIIAAPLVAWLALKFNWHAAFIVPGLLGLGVAGLWWLIYRDPPDKAQGEQQESAEAFRWQEIWRTRTLYGVLLCRFISDPVWYFCLFWLPGYLQEESGLTLAQIGMVGWIPFLAADIGGVGSSLLSDRLVKRGFAPLRARKLTLLGAALIAPICALTPHFPSPTIALLIFSVVGAVCLTWLFSMGVVVAEAFPSKNVGSVWGIAGAFGAAGAMIFNSVVGEVMHSLGPAKIFGFMALLHPTAMVVMWLLVRKESPPSRQPNAG